jgi:pilus assembly protein CpaB
MENMRVLAIGTEIQRDNGGKPLTATTVTLAVTPDQAERLAVAMNQGAIQLVLRGYGDPDSVRTKGATSGDVLSQLRGRSVEPVKEAAAPRKQAVRPAPVTPAPAPVVRAPSPAPPESLRVEVYRAGKATPQKFDTTTKDSITKRLP